MEAEPSPSAPPPQPPPRQGGAAARLEDKIDSLRYDFSDLRKLVHASLTSMVELNAELRELRTHVDRLNLIIRDGDGAPGLVARMAAAEVALQAGATLIEQNAGRMGSLSVKIDHFLDAEREYRDELVRDRDRATRERDDARRKLIWSIFLGVLGSAASAAATAILSHYLH